MQQFTLSELNKTIKETLQDTFPAPVWVVAEVSEMKENRTGHCHLELVEKEENTILARSRATIWSYTYRMLKPYFETTTGQTFSQGIKVLVQVSVEYHPAYGLSLNIKDIDPVYTVGDMAMQRKEIINRLKQEGVYEMNKELDLPLVPQKIAVISSATAAGYLDFINQLQNNENGFVFYTKLFEATMQGAETEPSIIRALEHIFQYDDFFDAVAIIRGGGATANLSSFDSYNLAYTITQFPLPIITGIGHEKDDTIIDLVAHTRMKTPTAVAEFLLAGVNRFYEQLLYNENEITQLTRNLIDKENTKLEQMAGNLNHLVTQFIIEKQMRISHLGNELQQNVNRFSFKKRHEINSLTHNLHSAVSLWFVETKNRTEQKRRVLKRVVGESLLKEEAALLHYRDLIAAKSRKALLIEHEKIKLSENTIRLLNPENILKRGYSLTLKNGKAVKSSSELNLNDEIETLFSKGKVKSKIVKKA